MKTTTSLCFTRDGLLNPEAVNFFRQKNSNTLVVFGDGTQEAYNHMKAFAYHDLIRDVSQLAVGKLPLHEMRVIGQEGYLSKPNYVYSDDDRLMWYCSFIFAPCITINVSDIASQSGTQVKLDRRQTEMVARMAYRFWQIIKTAEDHLGFPAMALDKIVKSSRILNSKTIDIEALRKETGLTTLDYHPSSDLLSIEVGSETFTVKLSVVDEFMKDFILPFFNRHMGRRYQLYVTMLGISKNNEPSSMTYGELGYRLEHMQQLVKESTFTDVTPMDPQDLLSFSKEVTIHEESCLFASGEQTIDDFLTSAHALVVRTDPTSKPISSAATDDIERPAELVHS